MTMIKSLKVKVDAIKTQGDLNDDYVKTQVDAKTSDIMDKLTVLSQADRTTWNAVETVKQKLSQHDEQLMTIHGQMSEASVRTKDFQA